MNKLRQRVKEIVEEYLRRRDESNVTANIDGYQTPVAFYKRSVSPQDMYRDTPRSSAYKERPPTKKLFGEGRPKKQTDLKRYKLYKSTFPDNPEKKLNGETHYMTSEMEYDRSTVISNGKINNIKYRELAERGEPTVEIVFTTDDEKEVKAKIKQLVDDDDNSINDLNRVGGSGRKPGDKSLSIPEQYLIKTIAGEKVQNWISSQYVANIPPKQVDKREYINRSGITYYRLLARNVKKI